MFRRRRDRERQGELVDLATIAPPWLAPVTEAVQARARFRALLAGVAEGALRDRLEQLGEKVDSAVLGSYAIAQRAQAAEAALVGFDADALTAQLKDARRRADSVAADHPDRARLDDEVAMIATQHASVNRIRNDVEEASEQLRLLDLRLDAAVAQAAELALRPGSSGFDAVEGSLDGLITELDAMRAAFDELR